MDEGKNDFTIFGKSPSENIGKYEDKIPTEVDILNFLRRSVNPTYSGFVDDKHKEYFDLLSSKIGDHSRADILGANKTGIILSFNSQADKQSSGIYLEDFLQKNLPKAFLETAELEKQLGEELQFYIWVRKDEHPIFIVQRESGERAVLRIVYSASRSLEEINEDIPQKPSIVPDFQVVPLAPGKIGTLIDFIDGHQPVTEEEKQLCIGESQKLLDVPMLEYDVSDINFIIEEGTGKPYYIDRDIVEGIIRNGLSPQTAESRKSLLEREIERMYPFGRPKN